MSKLFYTMRRSFLKHLIPEFLWPKEIIVDTIKFKVRNTPYSFGTKLSLVRGNYEIAERTLIKDYIFKDDIIIEMGGSIGVLTAILANKIASEGFLVSIEASKSISHYSRKWLEKPNVKILTGFGFPVYHIKQDIRITKFDETGGSLGGIVKYTSENKQEGFVDVSKDIFDLKKICNSFNIIPTVLVIDIEGSETIITKQTPNFPLSINTILIELHPHLYSQEEQNAIIQKIIDDGFVLKKQLSTSYLFIRA